MVVSTKLQPKVPFSKEHQENLILQNQLDFFCGDFSNNYIIISPSKDPINNASEFRQRPKSFDYVIKKWGNFKEKYTLVKVIDITAKVTYSHYKSMYEELPSPKNTLGYALKPTAKILLGFEDGYGNLRTQYPIVGSIGDFTKNTFNVVLYGAAAYYSPYVVGAITATNIVFPEVTGEIMAVGEYLYKGSLWSLNSDFTQREVDALGSTTKFILDLAAFKALVPPALQKVKNVTGAAGKFFNVSNVKPFDVRTLPKDARIFDIGESSNPLRPFNTELNPIFQEITTIKPNAISQETFSIKVSGSNIKLLENSKAPSLSKTHTSTLPTKITSELSIIEKANQQGRGFRLKESIIISQQNKTQKISTPGEEAMEMIRSNPHIFQTSAGNFDSGTSSAYATSSAIISPIKPSISCDSPTDITKSWIFKLEGNDSKIPGTKITTPTLRESVDAKFFKFDPKTKYKETPKENSSAVKEFYIDLKQYILKEAKKGNLRFGNNKVINEIIEDYVPPILRFHDVSHQLSPEVSDYLRDKLKIELWVKISTHNPYTPIPASSVKAKEALYDKYSLLEAAQKKAMKTKTLPDGRIRYYEEETPSYDPNHHTRGSSAVVEYNPKTGRVVKFMEVYDHQGNTVMVHVKNINGQQAIVNHFPINKVEREIIKSKK